MSGLTWSPASGNVFTEVTGTFVFTDDDVRAVYIDWDDGPSNKKSEANYQWEQFTEPVSSIPVKHTYTASGTFNPVIQTMNSKGFFSKYFTSGTAGSIGVNTEVSPSVGDSGITDIVISDGLATGVMRVENKTVRSGIDNSIFDREGPKDIELTIPPLCTEAELTTISSITIEITALVDSTMLNPTDSTTVAGGGRSVQIISTTYAIRPWSTGNYGFITVAVPNGGQISKVLKVKYKNPKYVTDPTDYDSNAAYKNLKVFLVVLGDDGFYYPITYVTAGAPIKIHDDSTRYITMDFSQSRAKASNVSALESYRYDNGKVWFSPTNQWAVSGAIFGDQTKQLATGSGELKTVSYTYSNVRPDGLNGAGGLYTAFLSGGTADWARDASNEQKYRVDQFIVDEFGRFTPQYHMVRMSADPNTTDYTGTTNVSSISNNKPYVFRMTPGIDGYDTGNDYLTKIDVNVGATIPDVNYTSDYTDKAFANASGNLVSLSGMNDQAFKTLDNEDRTANESLLLLFSSKTNKLFFNMSNYSNLLLDTNLAGSSFTTPWKISGVSYLVLENAGSIKQHAYWQPVDFDDTTKVSMEYRSTTYTEQSNSLSQSGYLSYDMPSNWAAISVSGLCGYLGIDDAHTAAGTYDITVTGTAISTAASVGGYGNYVDMTVGNPSDIEDVLTDDEIGAFRYIFIITNDGGGSGVGGGRCYWVAKGAGNGYASGTNKLSLHFGADISTSYQPKAGTANTTGTLRRVNIYDILDGYSKGYISGTTSGTFYPVGAGALWDNTYMFGDTTAGVSQALKDAWDESDLYALKISLSGAASGSDNSTGFESLYPELWNVFDATQVYESIVKEIDDTAYNLNALPITSDLTIGRGGTYYSAITRKGKVFIARTGDKIQNISLASVGMGDETTFATYSVPSSLYGQLRTVRKLQGNTVRAYWDEKQKDGTFVRYWGIITSLDETHAVGSPNAILSYSFNLMIEEIALIDTNGNLITDLFPLGGISDGRDYS